MTTTFPFPSLPETLTTTRLRLRAPVAADAPRIAMFIGDWDVAKMLPRVPHPYREADALAWISKLSRQDGAHYVMVHANGVVGVVGIEAGAVEADAVAGHKPVAELGYWLAKPFWGRGLMTEATRAVVQAYRACDVDAPLACNHFDDNAGSKRVIEKLGFVSTGVRLDRSVARDAEVRLITYRLPLTTSATPPPRVLTPA